MSDYGDNVKYKWTPESTTLLVSVWTDKQVQKQLDYASRQQLIWESVARYMRKKGYEVSAKQCRSRMKQVLVCYREAKRVGTRAGVEQYYDSIDKVLKTKKTEQNDINGVDTVDSAAPIKSPPKDVKTNKNLRMRFNKYSEPIESLIRTEALSPTWHLAHEEEYPDSPESNETVLAHPFRAFSPTRDAATNTLNGPSQLLAKARRSLPLDEQPIRETRHLNSVPNNRFGEMLYQNAVQNVQNQIIQENMQQRNILQNQLIQEETMMQPEQLYRRNSTRNPFYTADDIVPSKLRSGTQRIDSTNNQPIAENMMRMQNQLQQTCATDNRAVPQEPRRANYRQNLSVNYKLYKEAPQSGCFLDQNLIRTRQRVGNYSPETAANLNETFCQTHKDERNLNFNDSYEQPMDNDIIRGMNATTLTNNATFNDDTLSIEFLEGSPSPSDNGATGTKSVSGNSDKIPDAPVRKKKVQKLEQLMLSAISSQNEVVNKILAAQDAMVSRFLDLDRDRQNRLENRLDHLMNVVHATVLNKSPEKETESPIPPALGEPLITNLVPPPRPGTIPPKLDLVPPKPCRVACTSANTNVELVNQKPCQTRPGVVSPSKAPGSIWSKLGPVSQSPFVKAQQQLGLRSNANPEYRTQSSVERKIARELASMPMDPKTIIFETDKFLENEVRIEEQIENARILSKMGQEIAARRKLFAGRGEPNAGIILTAAFLDSERYAASNDVPPVGKAPSSSSGTDDEELMLLAGQVEKYERLRRLNMQSRLPNEPCDTSTPAKAQTRKSDTEDPHDSNEQVPRQTIQQLAELVMKSARWKDAAANNQTHNRWAPPTRDVANGSNNPPQKNHLNIEEKNRNEVKRVEDLRDQRRSYAGEAADRESRNKALGWLQDRYSYGGAENSDNRNIQKHPNVPYEGPVVLHPSVQVGPHPMGFTTDNLNVREEKRGFQSSCGNTIGFNPDILVSNNYGRRNVAFADLEEPQILMEKTGQATYPRQRRVAPEPPQQQNQYYGNNNGGGQFSTLPVMHRNMIDRYVQDNRGPVIRKNERGQDSDEDEEFLDTTTTMPSGRKTSLTLSGTSSGKAGNCTIS